MHTHTYIYRGQQPAAQPPPRRHRRPFAPHLHTYKGVDIHMSTLPCRITHTYTHRHTHTYTHICTIVSIQIDRGANAALYLHTHARTDGHHTRRHTRPYTHTYIYKAACCSAAAKAPPAALGTAPRTRDQGSIQKVPGQRACTHTHTQYKHRHTHIRTTHTHARTHAHTYMCRTACCSAAAKAPPAALRTTPKSRNTKELGFTRYIYIHI